MILVAVQSQGETVLTQKARNGAFTVVAEIRVGEERERVVRTGDDYTVLGRPAWGFESEGWTASRVVGVSFKLGSKTHKVPKALFHDLYEVGPGSEPECFVSQDGSRFAVKFFGGDSAGGYRCLIQFKKGKFTRQISGGN